MAMPIPRYNKFLQTAHLFFLILGGIYVVLIALAAIPFVQRQ